MQILGDLFTRYHYSTIDISLKSIATTYEVKSQKGDINILVDTLSATELPAGSPFNDWQEARRFAGPLPFTFSFDSTKKPGVDRERRSKGLAPVAGNSAKASRGICAAPAPQKSAIGKCIHHQKCSLPLGKRKNRNMATAEKN